MDSKIIKEYVPHLVKYVVGKIGIPKDEDELIEFSQELAKKVIEKCNQSIAN